MLLKNGTCREGDTHLEIFHLELSSQPNLCLFYINEHYVFEKNQWATEVSEYLHEPQDLPQQSHCYLKQMTVIKCYKKVLIIF